MTKPKNTSKPVTVDAYGEVPEEVQPQKIQRIYKNQNTIDHDLFRFEPAKLIKNHGYSDEEPLMASIEHSHFFHSVDGNGEKLIACSPIAGHFHFAEVHRDADGELVLDKNGKPQLTNVSGPKKYVKQKVAGHAKLQQVAVDVIVAGTKDEHMHKWTYIESEKIQLRQANAEAIKLQTADLARMNPPTVAGVHEG
jgi:hypothetical protein